MDSLKLLLYQLLLLGSLSFLNSTNVLATNFVCETFDCVNRTTIEGLGSNRVNNVFVTNGIIYAATNKGLSISTDGGATFTTKTQATNGLGADLILDVHVSNGVIYAATDGGGLAISTDGGATFTNRVFGTGLGADVIFSVHESDGKIYVGTFGSGFWISSNGGTTFYQKNTSNGLASNFVKDVFAVNGNIYAGTNNGLSISTNGGTSFSNYISHAVVFDVFASGGVIYAATYSGLYISADGGSTFDLKRTTEGLGSNRVYGVYVAGGTVYAATDGGLSISKYGGNMFVNKTTADGLGSNNLNGVFELDGTIYVATENGLTICNTQARATLVSSDEDNAICSGDEVTFTATGGEMYNFLLNGTSVQNSASNTYSTTSLNDGDVVKVVVTNSSNCQATSSEITTTVILSSPAMEDNLTVNDPINLDEYMARIAISSAGTIADGMDVTFLAGDSIMLKPGFSVVAGAAFHSEIRVGCPPPGPIISDFPSTFNQTKLVTNPLAANTTISMDIQPNPFQTETTLVLSLKNAEQLTILLADQTGKVVSQLRNGQNFESGAHSISLNASYLQGSFYYVILQSATERMVKKLVVFGK